MSSQDSVSRRELTPGERLVLARIQALYGPQNSEDRVSFSNADEAVIVVRDRNGASGLFAVLTNLAAMLANGEIASVEELDAQWLTVG